MSGSLLKRYKMKKRFAKFLSIFLVIVMVAGALPIRQVVLADTDETVAETETQKEESDSDKTPETKPSAAKEQDKEEGDKTPAPDSEPDETKETSNPSTGVDDDKNSGDGKEAEPETSETEAAETLPESKTNTPSRNAGETPINSVSVTIAAPSVGAKPSYSASLPSGAKYYIDEDTGVSQSGYNNTILWYDTSIGSSVDPDTGVFLAGHQYRVSVYLTASTGYAFDFDNIKATINGNTATTERMVFDRLKVTYYFQALNGQVSDVIQSVEITLDAPEIGKAPDFEAVFPAGANYYSADYNVGCYKNDIYWYDETNGIYLEPGSSVFAAGRQYRVTVALSAREGYSFNKVAITAKLNGQTVVASMSGKKLEVSYTFPKLTANTSQKISSVSVTLDAPSVGSSPDYTAGFPSNANYSAQTNGIVWWDITANSQVNSSSGKFIGGHQYRVEVYLTPNTGYYFDYSTTATLNGQSASKSIDSGRLKVTYTFPTLNTVAISSVALTLDAPSNGASPDYTASFASGVNYQSASNSSGNYRNGIRWYDVTSGSEVNASSGKFQAGHQYRVEAYLTAKDGYNFNSSTTAKVNNATATAVLDGSQLKVTYTFSALPNTAISSVALTLDAPSNGASPDYTATFASGANYQSVSNNSGNYRNGIRWYDVTSGSEVNASSGKFQAGHQYRVEAYLTAKTGYAFNSSTTAKVNNATATAALDGSQLKVTYTFNALSLITISSVAVTVDAPSNGASPDYTAVLASGANYSSTVNNAGNFRNGIRWYDVTSNSEVNASSGKFQAGHQYRVEVYLTAKDGYCFNSSTTAKVNNIAAAVTMSGSQLNVSYTFNALSLVAISSVALTLDAPSYGSTPDYTAAFASGVNYSSASINSGYYRNGIKWTDVTANDDVNPASGTFKAGHQYKVEVYLAANTGYAFNSSTTAKVNSAAASVSMDGSQLKVTYTFKALASFAISGVDITLDAPSNGAKPDYTPIFPTGIHYSYTANNTGNYRNGIRWVDATSNTEVDASSETFKAGHKYKVEVYLTPDDGYCFNSSTTARINNTSATVAVSGSQLKVSYTFTAIPIPVVNAKIYCYNETTKAKITDGSVYVSKNKGTQIAAGADQIVISNNAGETFTLTAGIISGGYTFNGWYSGVYGNSGATLISTDPTISVNISADTNYYASFTKPQIVIPSLTFIADKGPVVGMSIGDCTPTVTVAEAGVTVTGRSWRNTSGSTLSSTSIFTAGQKVMLYVTYKVNQEYKLADNIKDYTTLNGSRPGTHDTSNHVITVTYTAGRFIDVDGIEITGLVDKTYTGEAITQTPVVKENGRELTEGKDYRVTYANNIEAGTATVVISGMGNYAGAKTATFEILQASNNYVVKGKTTKVKYRKLRKKTQLISRSKVLAITNAKGTLRYSLVTVKRGKSKKYKKYFKINAVNGIVTVKKKLRKGKYKVTVRVSDSGDSNYKGGSKSVTFTVKVK